MISQEQLKQTERRIEELEDIIGSDNVVLDEEGKPVKTPSIFNRLSEVSEIQISLKNKHKFMNDFITLCKFFFFLFD